MKADRKLLRRVTGNVTVLRNTELGWLVRALLAFCVTRPAGLPVQAEIVESNARVKILEVGGHCEVPPDLVLPAPLAGGGKFQCNYGSAAYVITGDRFSAQLELASVSASVLKEIDGVAG